MFWLLGRPIEGYELVIALNHLCHHQHPQVPERLPKSAWQDALQKTRRIRRKIQTRRSLSGCFVRHYWFSHLSPFYVTFNLKTVFSKKTHLRIIFIACNEGKFYSYALDAIRILDLIWNIHRNVLHTDLVVLEKNLDLFKFVSIYKFYKWS